MSRAWPRARIANGRGHPRSSCPIGAPARRILGSVLARATRQLAIGVALGLAAAVWVDQLTGGALMEGNGLLLIPATAAFMLLVGLLAAGGPARRGLRIQPTEALRAE